MAKGLSGRPTKIDWVQARKDYLADPTVSYAKLAEVYGVSLTTMEERAQKEGWVRARRELGIRTMERAEGQLVNVAAEANDRHTAIYREMQKPALLLLKQYLAMIVEEQAAAKLANRAPRQVIYPRDLKALNDALKVAVDGERITLMLPTNVSKNEVTGAGGAPLFKEHDNDELEQLIERAIEAIAGNAKTKASD